MLEKLKDQFKEVELTCSKCGKTIKEGGMFFGYINDAT